MPEIPSSPASASLACQPLILGQCSLGPRLHLGLDIADGGDVMAILKGIYLIFMLYYKGTSLSFFL